MPGSGLGARGFTGPGEGDPGTTGKQGDVLTQRPGAKPPRQSGGTAQPGGTVVAVPGAQRRLGGAQQGHRQRVGLADLLPCLRGLVPGNAPIAWRRRLAGPGGCQRAVGACRLGGEGQLVSPLRQPLHGQLARLGAQPVEHRRCPRD
jgi:hypothetical protein